MDIVEVTEEEYLQYFNERRRNLEELLRMNNLNMDKLFLYRSRSDVTVTYYRDGCQYFYEVEVAPDSDMPTPLQDQIDRITGVYRKDD